MDASMDCLAMLSVAVDTVGRCSDSQVLRTVVRRSIGKSGGYLIRRAFKRWPDGRSKRSSWELGRDITSEIGH